MSHYQFGKIANLMHLHHKFKLWPHGSDHWQTAMVDDNNECKFVVGSLNTYNDPLLAYPWNPNDSFLNWENCQYQVYLS